MTSNLARRCITVPLYLGVAAVTPFLLLALLPPLALADMVRNSNWALVRASLFIAAYVSCEAIGIIAAATVWAVAKLSPNLDDESYQRANFSLQRTWASTIYRAVELCFGIDTKVDGDHTIEQGPFLMFSRHVSTADTLLPAVLVSEKHDILLKYVLKRELLWDPCLDIVGQRLPNHFVNRNSDNRADEIEKVAALADGLEPHEGVLIYPEGTRCTPSKQKRALARVAAGADPTLTRIARKMRNVMPPRLGGPIALLLRNDRPDVVLCAHTGFEGIESLADIFDGSLIGRVINVQFRRILRKDIPADPTALRHWLFREWLALDNWVDNMRIRTESSALGAAERCES